MLDLGPLGQKVDICSYIQGIFSDWEGMGELIMSDMLKQFWNACLSTCVEEICSISSAQTCAAPSHGPGNNNEK